MSRVSAYLPAVVLAAGLALTASVRTQRPVSLRAPLNTLPSRIDGFTATERTIAAEELAVSGVSEYSMRAFTDGAGRSFSTYVGYYPEQSRGRTIHSPKNCLPGAGWETIASGTLAIGNDAVNRVVLAQGSQRAVVYYWYQGRGRTVANEYRVKWNLLRDAALTRRTEEALARIVVMVDAPGTVGGEGALAQADSLATGAARALMPALKEVLPPLSGAGLQVSLADR